MQVQITSTTDTEAEVRAAIGGKKTEVEAKPVEEKEPSASPEETPADENESEESDASETEQEPTETDDDESDGEGKEENPKPKKKGGYQKRIDKLTKQRAAAEQEREYWRQEALKHQQPKPNDEPKITAAPSEDKPKSDQFETHEEWIEALTDWKAEQRDKAKEIQSQEAKIKAQFQERASAHNARVESFASKQEDFADLMEEAGDVSVPIAMEEAILDSELGPQLIYELLKNRKELNRIAALGPFAIAREMGKLEARLAKSEESAPIKELKKSNTPTPITPLGKKSAGSVQKNPDEMSYSEFKKWRETNS